MSNLDRRRLLVTVLIAVATDVLTKVAALRWLSEPVLVPGLTLRLARNPGMAFSLGAGQPTAVVLAITGPGRHGARHRRLAWRSRRAGTSRTRGGRWSRERGGPRH